MASQNLLTHLRLHQKIAFFFSLLFFVFTIATVSISVYIFQNHIIKQKQQELQLQLSRFQGALHEISEHSRDIIQNFTSEPTFTPPLQELAKNSALYSRIQNQRIPLNNTKKAIVFQHQYELFQSLFHFLRIEQLSKLELIFLSPHQIFDDLPALPFIQMDSQNVHLNFFYHKGKNHPQSYLGPTALVHPYSPNEFLSIAQKMKFLGFNDNTANQVLADSGLSPGNVSLDTAFQIDPNHQRQLFEQYWNGDSIVLHIETVLSGNIFNPITEQTHVSPLAILIFEKRLDSSWLQSIKKKLEGDFGFVKAGILGFSSLGIEDAPLQINRSGWVTLNEAQYLGAQTQEPYFQEGSDSIYPITLSNADFIQQATQEIILVIGVIVLFLLVILMMLTRFLVRRLVENPLSDVMEGVNGIIQGNLALRVQVESRDEIGTLADSFNQMVSAVQEAQNQQKQAFSGLQTMNETFEKFVPRQFLKRIASGGLENIKLGQAKTETITVLFSDIRAFTKLSETLSPQEVMNFLNSFLQRMNDPIHKYHGFIDKFIGDGIMALFDRPYDSADDAVHAAIGMIQATHKYNVHRAKSGYPPIEIGLGVHTGEVIIGTVGSEDRMDSTVLGDNVNLASRVEQLTKLYRVPIIITFATYEALKQRGIICRELGLISVKGKQKPEWIFEVLCEPTSALHYQKQLLLSPYKKAKQHYYAQQWDAAIPFFQQCLDFYPDDTVSQIYLDRCQHYQTHPPDDDWDGVLHMQQN